MMQSTNGGNSLGPRRAVDHDVAQLRQRAGQLLAQGQLAEARALLIRGAEQFADNGALLAELAHAHRLAGKLLDALHAFDRVIGLGVATAEVWFETGDVLTDVGEYAQAIGAYERALELQPGFPEAEHNLGRVRYRLGDVDSAVRHLRAAAGQGSSLIPWRNLAVAIPGAPSADHAQIYEARVAFAQRLREEAKLTDLPRRPAQNSSGRRLRVGYVSAFFHKANYMKPVWALIRHHDRQAFELHFFSDSPADQEWSGYQSDVRDRRHDTTRLDNRELGELIRGQQIDLLVDLNGYSHAERLALFLAPCAPVVLGWFNLYATSGLPGIDYLVGDPQVIRPEEEPYYTEQIVRLPVSYLTFQVAHAAPPVVPPPCRQNGYLTFGSLVAQYKITPPVLDCWCDILRRVPAARLFLANADLKSLCNREYLRDQFIQRGVDGERVSMQGPSDHYQYLKNYDRIDIALDAFPYNGGTTTMEAIWQGTPVLTFAGDRWASRTSPSLLWHSPLRNFIAASAGQLVERAVALAHDPQTPSRLESLRAGMRAELQRSGACDGRQLAAGMEDVYREIWRRAAQGERPAKVPPA